ncbi:integral membrane sensor signal transduction histidine kinase [Haloterrigena turkmenica DSM 5511]|uniref:histidine kinase n=1 Tax=Haloterrigena turkmenica (strain ATCC 51198 / DSM 5511 / JCM 9101 / NCIMB 13204 / VKM B-1734 / 4k) TaxID=543526 RepID=D2RQB0_HALTV|nr:ATP-binding protein [Haloterrigena turkmenica]ADB62287.1 integral membrane sensor signal transduction histidine kinase [Haloterrigena turkmenica DSM 5511]
MVGESIESGSDAILESSLGDTRNWLRGLSALGALLVLVAVGNSIVTMAGNGILLEAILDLLLVGSFGIVLLYIGLWLPKTSIDAAYYPRILLWVVVGVTVMGIALGLRVLHPGVEVQFTFGTQAVFLAIGSVAGLAIGVHEAQALIQAAALEEQNEALKRTEQRLEETVEELEASNEQLEQFAYAASHDLQEPLRMVTSYLDLLEDRYADEFDDDGEEFLAFARDGADRMDTTIDALLEYSRVETQGGAFDTVDLEAILDDVLADLQFKLEEEDADLTREPLPAVAGDESQLRQVFQNLLANAIEYSGGEPPRIHIAATPETSDIDTDTDAASAWRISVSDEGPGIPTDDQDRIFEIFQRLHSSEEQSGSGIGLALCQRIVERHGVRPDSERPGSTDERSESVGGEIWVDSEPGEGSTFSLTLPSADASADADASDHAASPAKSDSRSRD